MINMLSKLVEIAPCMYHVSHVNTNMYIYSEVTGQLYAEITYLFSDYEITLFLLLLGKINAPCNIIVTT